MKITIYCVNDNSSILIDISDQFTILDIKNLINNKINIDIIYLNLYNNTNQILQNNTKFINYISDDNKKLYLKIDNNIYHQQYIENNNTSNILDTVLGLSMSSMLISNYSTSLGPNTNRKVFNDWDNL